MVLHEELAVDGGDFVRSDDDGEEGRGLVGPAEGHLFFAEEFWLCVCVCVCVCVCEFECGCG